MNFDELIEAVENEKPHPFGQRLLQVRQDLGISQEECARKSGLSLGYWSQLERGHYPIHETYLKRRAACKSYTDHGGVPTKREIRLFKTAYDRVSRIARGVNMTAEELMVSLVDEVAA